MKAILEFNLPEEQEEYKLARNGLNLSCAVWDYDQEVLRSIVKYNNTAEIKAEVKTALSQLEGLTSEETTDLTIEITAQYLRQKLHACLEDHEVSI